VVGRKTVSGSVALCVKKKILMFIYPIYNHNLRNISNIYIYKTRLASNEIFSPSNKIYWRVGRAKDLSAPRVDYIMFWQPNIYMSAYLFKIFLSCN